MLVDRKEGGVLLARALKKYEADQPIVLSILRGGLETGYHVAKYLQADFNILITKKLEYPHNPKAGYGAMAEDGSFHISDNARKRITEDIIAQGLEDAKSEISRRIEVFRDGLPLPALENRCVIIIDDGIATADTFFAASQLCRNQMVSKIIVATPVAGRHMFPILKRVADEVIILDTPENFYSVSDGYMNYPNISDEEALAFVKRYEEECAGSDSPVETDQNSQ